MLDIKKLQKDPKGYEKLLASRGEQYPALVKKTVAAHSAFVEAQQAIETIKAKKNAFSRTIAQLSHAEKATKLKELAQLTEQEKELTNRHEIAHKEMHEALRVIPNIPASETPVGKSDSDNAVIKTVGDPPMFSFDPLDYVTLAERHKLIDTERAAKVSGSRFGYLLGDGALLWNALVQYTLSVITRKGFIPFFSPVLVRAEVMRDSGYDSYVEGGEAYYLKDDDLYLVGTGEHALLPFHRDEILSEDSLPRKYTTYSSCFRREAGSYGKDTKGILRVHQFEKQEMVVLCTPETSDTTFAELVALQEHIISGLGLPYHLLAVCTGDLPRPSAQVIDLECWIPSEKKYRETHSASNCTDYQARDNNIRYKGAAGTQFVHILNATAITPRTLIAILENYQLPDGSIGIPTVLQPYLNGKKIISQKD